MPDTPDNPNPPPVLEELTAILAGLVKSASTANQIGSKRLSYYTPKYATWAKDLIDKIITTGEPHIIPIGDLAFNTIKLQWYQSTKYLVDHLDDEKHSYKAKLELLESIAHKSKGLFISPKRRKGILLAYEVRPWKNDFHAFIDSSQDSDTGEMLIFERIGIGITEDDARYVNNFMAPLEDLFVWNVDVKHDSLKVIRVDKVRAEAILTGDVS